MTEHAESTDVGGRRPSGMLDAFLPVMTDTATATSILRRHTAAPKAFCQVHPCRRILWRVAELHGCLALVLFVSFAVLCVVLLTVTWGLTLSPVQRAFAEAHRVHVVSLKARCEVTSISLVRVVSMLAALWRSQPQLLNPSTMSESVLCNIVDNAFESDAYLRSIGFLSESLGEARFCFRTYNATTQTRMLMGVSSLNGTYRGGVYLVDNDTHRYHEPLTEVLHAPSDGEPVSEYFVQNPVMHQLIDEGFLYRAGQLANLTRAFVWNAAGAKPTLFYCTYPVAVYETQDAVDRETPDGRAVLQTRLDLQDFFDRIGYPQATRAVLLDPRSLRSDQSDPNLAAASWMPRVTNDTDVWSFPNTSRFFYARVSDITDDVMRAGLRYVKMSDFRKDTFENTKTFYYGGVQSIVTWGRYSTSYGFRLPFILVDTGGPVRGLVEAKFLIIVCSSAFAVVAIPIVFSALIDEVFGRPMRAIASSLTRAGELGNKKARRHIRDDARIVIVEVDDLIDAHNDAMDILRAVEAYLPHGLFGDDDHADTLGGSMSSSAASESPSAIQRAAAQSQSLFESVASVVAHGHGKPGASALRQMRVSLVTLHAVARSVDTAALCDREVAPPVDDCPTHGGLEALRVLDRERYDPPTPAFSSRWALQDYASVVMQVAEQRHGTVMRVAPELTVVCFGGMMEALTRGTAASALGPSLEAKACATDASAAVLFAHDVRSRLQQLAARDSKRVPDVVAVVDTNTYNIGVCRIPKLQQSLSVAVGPTPAPSFTPPRNMTEGCVAASTATTQALTNRTRFVPRAVLHVCTRHRGHAKYTAEILHQMIDGAADTPAWRAQYSLLLKAFQCLYAADYRSALNYIERMPVAARGDMSLMSGAQLDAAMRAGAATGASSAKVYGAAQSGLLAQLTQYCDAHLRNPLAVNTILAPRSYLEMLAYRLPPLAARSASECGSANASVSKAPSRSCPSVAATLRGEYRSTSMATLRPQRTQLTGVKGLVWIMPLRDGSEDGKRPLGMEMTVLSTTGSIALAVEMHLHPGALAKLSLQQIRRFVEAPDSPYVIQTEDLVVSEAEQRAIAVAELVFTQTARTYLQSFPHASSVALCHQHFFCAAAALASLDAEGYAHAQLKPDDLVLLRGGMTKLKALFGKPEDILSFVRVGPTYYMSPEEAAGAYPTIFSNVYSVAVVGVELITRRLPYRWTATAAADRTAAELVTLQEQCDPAFLRALAEGLIEPIDIPDELGLQASMRGILHQCLQRDPALRPRPRDVLRMFRTDPHLASLVRDFPSGPWEH